MMNQKRNANIANFMYHTMLTWKQCQVHWMVDYPIDSLEMWIDDDVWNPLTKRFSVSSSRPD